MLGKASQLFVHKAGVPRLTIFFEVKSETIMNFMDLASDLITSCLLAACRHQIYKLPMQAKSV